MDLNLKGKRVLVTGSSQGIGLAVATALASEGARVAICSRSEENLKKAKEQSGAETYFVCDLSKPGEAKALTQQAIEHFGGLDVLVTNAGGPPKGKFKDLTLEQWQETFQGLWLAVIESLQVALPVMQKQKFGRVVMITSCAAEKPIPGLTASGGMRRGLEGLAESLTLEYAGDGITFNLILPGYTNTERLKELNLSEEKVKALVPTGRLGDPKELSDLVTFLASEKAAYVNGQAIGVDGGCNI